MINAHDGAVERTLDSKIDIFFDFTINTNSKSIIITSKYKMISNSLINTDQHILGLLLFIDLTFIHQHFESALRSF